MGISASGQPDFLPLRAKGGGGFLSLIFVLQGTGVLKNLGFGVFFLVGVER